jgi:N-dimethylarginine dimethylaminohydrolase
MINRYDTFTQLKEVIVGTVNPSVCHIIKEPTEREFMLTVLESVRATQDQMADIFQSHNIVVHRPKPITLQKPTVTPHTEVPAMTNPVAPADNYLTIADTIIHCANVSPHYYFDHEQYQHIWQAQFSQGARWIAMPRPTFVHDQEPQLDAPAVMLVGNTVFYADRTVTTPQGIQWLQQEFDQFDYQPVNYPAHLDSYFHVLRPGVVLSSVIKHKLPPCFATWDVITVETAQSYADVKVIDGFIQDDDWANTELGVNVVSINERTVMMMRHGMEQNPGTVKAIKQHGIDVVPVDYTAAKWMNQGLSCMINQLCREGGLENYF